MQTFSLEDTIKKIRRHGTDWEKYLYMIYLIRYLDSENKELLKLSSEKSDNSVFKMSRRFD